MESPTRSTALRPDTATKLPVVILAGFHSPALTEKMLDSLPSFTRPSIIAAFPAAPSAAYQWLQTNVSIPSGDEPPAPPIVAIGFSAGVVGLARALALWQQQGGNVGRFIAVDGWGVPIMGLPVTRMSHDRFTHLSTLPLGAGGRNFYADPAVSHLKIWGEPEAVQGLAVTSSRDPDIPMSAAEFLRRVLHAEWNAAFNWRAKR